MYKTIARTCSFIYLCFSEITPHQRTFIRKEKPEAFKALIIGHFAILISMQKRKSCTINFY
jgi:hypothetical protein